MVGLVEGDTGGRRRMDDAEGHREKKPRCERTQENEFAFAIAFRDAHPEWR